MEMLEDKQVGKMTRNDVVENDRAVERELNARLREYFFFAVQRFNWEFREGVVVLRGQVNTFHEKQMAQERARRVDGVTMVVNRLEVDPNTTSRLVNEAVLTGN